ncbi:bifunctional nicotinamidase/pyrazinamidase [Acidicapsa acidisoli]|uniref:bifunctional nicotinamidase/pyrazinamidase n=1 Tax=Acidicapsa acidisoli TaxID=1615681 RepID=UPI0021DFE68C|nr:bifunctional nicotinamidase/pyrazinamidase [Acidicapsa acidisoli]
MTRPDAEIVRNDDLLLVIDVQRDFCSRGRLAVPDGDAVVPLINRLAAHFKHIVLTQDWHPAGHTSFASSHREAKPYDQIELAYGPQTLWPDHCIQQTPGAEFHPALDSIVFQRAELILRKGFHRKIDSYSAFVENDKQTTTGLAGYLRERGFRRIFLAGLAYDYCVRFSAVDAVRADFEAVVIQDACHSIGPEGETEREFAQVGVKQMQSREILDTRE